jgi:hypothetical protein
MAMLGGYLVRALADAGRGMGGHRPFRTSLRADAPVSVNLKLRFALQALEQHHGRRSPL